MTGKHLVVKITIKITKTKLIYSGKKQFNMGRSYCDKYHFIIFFKFFDIKLLHIKRKRSDKHQSVS